MAGAALGCARRPMTAAVVGRSCGGRLGSFAGGAGDESQELPPVRAENLGFTVQDCQG